MKRCPFCNEEIQDDAIKCKHCKEFLDGRSHGTASKPTSDTADDGVWCPNCKKKVTPQVSTPGCFTTSSTIDCRCPFCGKLLKQRCCFIATCAFGSNNAPEVIALSRFRDDTLLNYRAGRYFEGIYYKMGPTLVRIAETIPFIKRPIRIVLKALVSILPK